MINRGQNWKDQAKKGTQRHIFLKTCTMVLQRKHKIKIPKKNKHVILCQPAELFKDPIFLGWENSKYQLWSLNDEIIDLVEHIINKYSRVPQNFPTGWELMRNIFCKKNSWDVLLPMENVSHVARQHFNDVKRGFHRVTFWHRMLFSTNLKPP